MKRKKLYIDMVSCHVSDHFHITQCYKCQGYGHKSSSVLCKLKSAEEKCLYCAGSHRSKDCVVKKDTDRHKCVNCMSSKNPEIKSRAHNHNATSKYCPIYHQEFQNMKAAISKHVSISNNRNDGKC